MANRSIAAARAYGPLPEIALARRPLRPGTSPTRMICAPSAGPEPVGASRLSASAVAGGRAELPESRIGARMGGAISTEEAIAACQLSLGAMVTAVGWVPATLEGNTASATPAALATESAPETRVVFFVADTGKPIPWLPETGFWSGPVVFTLISVVVPPHPATVTQTANSAIGAESHLVDRIAPDSSAGRCEWAQLVDEAGSAACPANVRHATATCILPRRRIRGPEHPRSGGPKF